ncbi:MAG: hypothetical protein AAFR17_07875 [Pseudomonadota bacterium]
MVSHMRAHLDGIAEELARVISHPAYLEKVAEIHDAPEEAQYRLAEQLTVDWAREAGVPLSSRVRSVPRTFEDPTHAAVNGVQAPGIEPGSVDGVAPVESYDTSSWRSDARAPLENVLSPGEIAEAVRREMGEIADFVMGAPFQLLLGELRFTAPEDRPHFVLDVVLDEEERRARGVEVPANMLIQRSTFHDGRPTLFCVSKMTRLAAPWRKLTYTFDNDTLSM